MPHVGASSPYMYFTQQIQKNSAILSYFYVNKRYIFDTHLLETYNPHKLFCIYEINQAKKTTFGIESARKWRNKIWFRQIFY